MWFLQYGEQGGGGTYGEKGEREKRCVFFHKETESPVVG